jgi:putative ABC transport system permease protein
MALGADQRRVAAAVLRQGASLAAIGLATGLALAFAATPLLRNLPVTVRSPDAWLITPLIGAIGMVTVAACLLPALRAARVDPMTALRNE